MNVIGQSVSFVVPGEPVSQPRPRVFRGGRVVSDSPASLRWKRTIAWTFTAAVAGTRGTWPLEGPVSVHMLFRFSRPKRAAHPYPSRNDWDNLAKLACDALNKLAWKDDRQIVRAFAEKAYASANDGEGVVITITAV